jgi:hypothetical protein
MCVVREPGLSRNEPTDIPTGTHTASWTTVALSGRTRAAYFSMKIAMSPEMPTYSGAHGILAAVQAAQTVWLSPTRPYGAVLMPGRSG